jgi:uncharacterized protein
MEISTARGLGRLVGLAGRRDPGAGTTARDGPPVGLLLPRCRSVHTFGMRFALDLVWLGAGGAVVRIDRGVRPWRVRSCRRARSVLELRSGPAEELAAVLAERGLDVGAGG